MTPHVFLTRFNIPTNKVEHAIFSDAWLRERMDLFERFTLPSVRAQDAGDVHWLVYLGVDSPDWLRARMDQLAAEGLLLPRYLDRAIRPEELRADIRTVLGRGGDEAAAGDGPVSTSNLDNDDGLAHNFVARVREAAAGRPLPGAVYLTTGLIHHGTEVYLREDPDNAFGAVVADLADPDFATCWDEWHNRLAHLMPVTRAGGQPAWLQVIHGRNVSNRVRGRIADPRLHRSTFPGLLDDLDAPERAAVLRDAVRRPVRVVRDEVRGPVARIARQALGKRRFDQLKSRILRST